MMGGTGRDRNFVQRHGLPRKNGPKNRRFALREETGNLQIIQGKAAHQFQIFLGAHKRKMLQGVLALQVVE